MQLTATAPVGVVGSGTMGAGIAQIAAQAGHPVLLLDAVPGRAQTAVDGVGAQWDRMVSKGRLDPRRRLPPAATSRRRPMSPTWPAARW